MTSLDIERLMEAKNLPESDRDDVRKFSEFLQWRKDRADGKKVPPLSNDMKNFLLGKEPTT